MEVLAIAIKQEKERRCIEIGRKVKLSLFADTIYRKPWSCTKKTIRTNEFSKVAGYKISVQKSAAFLYTNNELIRKRKQSHL